MLMSLGGVDYTPHINESTYQINEVDEFKSWEDGNYRQHRISTRKRVSGSFNVALYGRDGMTAETFYNAITAATTNGVTAITVYVGNTGATKEISAYIEASMKSHRKVKDGMFVDIITVKVEER